MLYDQHTQTVTINSTILSPITHTFIGGMHKYNSSTRIKTLAGYYEATSSSLTVNELISHAYHIRFHLKITGINYKSNNWQNSKVYINCGSKSIEFTSDCEEVVDIVTGYDDYWFNITLQTYNNFISDTNMEISAFEIIPYLIEDNIDIISNYGYYGYYGYSFKHIIQKYFNTNNELRYIPFISTNGLLPDINSLDYNINGLYVETNELISPQGILLYGVVYTGNEQNSYQSYVFGSAIAKLDSLRLIEYNPYVGLYEDDFSLGPFKFGWYNYEAYNAYNSLHYDWKFTNRGLETPDIVSGSSSLYTKDFYLTSSISSVEVSFIIEGYLTGGITIGVYNIQTGDGLSFSTSNNYPEGNYTEILDLNGLNTFNFRLHISYYCYTYNNYYAKEKVIITNIKLNNYPLPSIGVISAVPSEEIFPNKQPSLPWEFIGEWAALEVDLHVNEDMLIAPLFSTDFSGYTAQYADCIFNFEAIDGEVEITLAVLGIYACYVYLDNGTSFHSSMFSIFDSTNYITRKFSVSEGSHSIIIRHLRYNGHGNTILGATVIKSIFIPTQNGPENIVFNQYDSANGGIIYDYTPGVGYVYTVVELGSSQLWYVGKISEHIDLSVLNSKPFFGTSVIGQEISSARITFPIKAPYYDNYSYLVPSKVYFKGSIYGGMPYSYYYSLEVSIECSFGGDSNHYTYYGNYYTTLYSRRVTYASSLPGYYKLYADLSLPYNTPDTGTVIFTVKALDAPANIGFYLEKVTLPVASIPIELSMLPIEDVVQFPITVSFSTTAEFNIYYTTDGADPKRSLNVKPYTLPFIITENKLIRYAFKTSDNTTWLEGEYSKLYLDKKPSQHIILYDKYMMGLDTYVIFYTMPSSIPVLIGKTQPNGLEFIPYIEPIKLNSGENTFLVTTPIIRNLVSMQPDYTRDFYNSPDLANSQLIVIGTSSEEPITGTRIVQLYSIEICISSFLPSIVPAIASGVYYNSITADFRLNDNNLQLLINSDVGWENYIAPIYIDISTNLELKIVSSYNNAEYLFYYNYIIQESEFNYANYACTEVFKQSIINYTSSIKRMLVEYDQQNTVYKNLFNYSGYTDFSANMLYDQYKEYIIHNNIFSLFTDSTLQEPFALQFKIVLQPSSYFTLTDENATLYIDNHRYTNIVQSGLVCKTTSQLASNTNGVIVPDMCLRLCIDSVYSIPVQVWTNIPKNNYLYADNTYVQLSNDNINYAQTIKLENNYLYIRCSTPASFSNSDDVLLGININIVSCEEYSVN